MAYASTEPGKSILTDRLVDVMFYYSLHQWVNSHREQGASWINAYHNPYLRNALVAIHETRRIPGKWKNWRKKPVSRAAFAHRFKELLGDTKPVLNRFPVPTIAIFCCVVFCSASVAWYT